MIKIFQSDYIPIEVSKHRQSIHITQNESEESDMDNTIVIEVKRIPELIEALQRLISK